MLRVVDVLTPERVRANRQLYTAYLRWVARYPVAKLRCQLRLNIQEAFCLRQAYFRALLRDALRSRHANETRIRQVLHNLDEQLHGEARQALDALERFRLELKQLPAWSADKQVADDDRVR
jgi:hypothetical protein